MYEEETKNNGANRSAEAQEEQARVEEFEVSGDKVMTKIKELIREGRTRRISLKNEQGTTLLEIPFTVGAAGALVGIVLAPIWVAIAAIAAMMARLKIVVERIEE